MEVVRLFDEDGLRGQATVSLKLELPSFGGRCVWWCRKSNYACSSRTTQFGLLHFCSSPESQSSAL